MPSIFHPQACEPAFHHAAGFVSSGGWEQLVKALDKVTPEQWCDAVDADWLLQLHTPAHQALLQIRNRLIGQRTLPAN